MVQATADLFPAPGSHLDSEVLARSETRFSKVEEEPKKAGQTCKEQIPARCERPREPRTLPAHLSKQQPPRINCVCVPGGGRAPPLLALRKPAGLETGQWGWGSEGLESSWCGGAGGQDKEGWELPVLWVAGGGLSSKALQGHLRPPTPIGSRW